MQCSECGIDLIPTGRRGRPRRTCGSEECDRKRLAKQRKIYTLEHHGLKSTYVHGCRCDDCKAAYRSWYRSNREAMGKPVRPQREGSPEWLGRKGRDWRRIREEIRALMLPCHICGEPIDYDAPPSSRSFSVDHIVPISMGGHRTDRANLAPAHFGCNSRKGGAARRTKMITKADVRNLVMELAEAIASGDRRLSLEAIRDRLVAEISRAQPREVAALSKLLVDVVRELDSLPSKEASVVDDLANARAARRAASAASNGPVSGLVSGS